MSLAVSWVDKGEERSADADAVGCVTVRVVISCDDLRDVASDGGSYERSFRGSSDDAPRVCGCYEDDGRYLLFSADGLTQNNLKHLWRL